MERIYVKIMTIVQPAGDPTRKTPPLIALFKRRPFPGNFFFSQLGNLVLCIKKRPQPRDEGGLRSYVNEREELARDNLGCLSCPLASAHYHHEHIVQPFCNFLTVLKHNINKTPAQKEEKAGVLKRRT